MKKINDRFELTELWLVKADWDRTFTGTVIREKAKDGTPILRGTVKVNEGIILSQANSEKELMDNMDAICTLKLDHNIHEVSGRKTQILDLDTDFFHN